MLLCRIPVALGIAGLLALPAAAQAAAPVRSTAPGQEVASGQEEAGGQDADFLKAAHQVNLAEIAGGRTAWAKTTNPQLKTLARTFMVDHIRMDSDLYQTARRLRVILPDAPTAEQQAQAKRYEAAGTDTFDEYYISTQLAGHRAALRMLAEQVDQGIDPSVTELATKATPIVTHHQQMLRSLAAAEGMAGYVDGGGRQG